MSPARQILASLCVIAVAAGGWYYFSNKTESATAPDGGQAAGGQGGFGGGGGRGLIVVTTPAAVDESGETITAIGSVMSLRSIEIYPQVTGIVEEVAIEPGALVEAGTPLLKLESEEQEIALERARIDLADAKAALERAERLGQTNAVSQVSVDNARSARKAAEIDVRSAELALSRRTVTVPFTGVVGLTSISIGDLVSTSTIITTLDDMSRMIVPFEVPQRYVGRVKIGQPVAASATALGGAVIKGEVISIDSRVAVETRAMMVKAALDGADGSLKPGMAVTMALELPIEPHLSVPSAAIQWDREGSYVWTVADGKAKRSAVTVIGRRSGSVLVAGDLARGDPVVVEGVQRLRAGASVTEAGRGGGRPGGDNRPQGAGGNQSSLLRSALPEGQS